MQLNEQPQKPNQVIEPTATRQPAPSRLKYLNKAYKPTNNANQQPKKGSTKAEQEYDLDLFNRYQQSKVISEETGKILKSDLKLRNEIAERNARLVSFVVNRLFNKSPRHKDLREDLIQEGHLGLYKAIDGFKPELGFKFSTYAVWWITQSISSFLQDGDPLIHVPSHIRAAKNKLTKEAKRLGISFESVDGETLRGLNVSDNMFEATLAARKVNMWSNVSLEAPLSSSVDMTLKDVLPSTDREIPSLMDDKRLVSAGCKAFARLTVREQHVLLERFGIDSTFLTEQQQNNGDKR